MKYSLVLEPIMTGYNKFSKLLKSLEHRAWCAEEAFVNYFRIHDIWCREAEKRERDWVASDKLCGETGKHYPTRGERQG